MMFSGAFDVFFFLFHFLKKVEQKLFLPRHRDVLFKFYTNLFFAVGRSRLSSTFCFAKRLMLLRLKGSWEQVLSAFFHSYHRHAHVVDEIV